MSVRQWWTAEDANNLLKGTDQMITRDDLGRKVRDAWVSWARQQPTPKPSWLVGYDDLTDRDQEADRQIGEALFSDGKDAGVDFVFDHLAKALGLAQWRPHDGSETWDGDVSATLWGLLYDAKIIDPETNKRFIQIKELVWHECMVDRGDGHSEPTGEWEALSPFGEYYIFMRDGSDSPYWIVSRNDNQSVYCESPDLAKAAAQDDFRKRVLKLVDLE